MHIEKIIDKISHIILLNEENDTYLKRILYLEIRFLKDYPQI